MRQQHDEATAASADSPTTTTEAKTKKSRTRKTTTTNTPKPAKVKGVAKPRARKKTAKVPPRLFARWAVCDNGMKRVAVFEYKDRVGADAKLAEMQERKPGGFFLLLVKDPCDPPISADPVAVV